MRRLVGLAIMVAVILVGIGPSTALAASPTNDNFANATVVDPAALPFSDTVAIDEATVEAEGAPCGPFGSAAQTVWYVISPTASGILRVDDSASFYYQFITVYRQDGSNLSGLTNVACSTWYYGQSGTSFHALAGQTYYIQAGSNFSSSGSITVSVRLVAPPANDNFASATTINPASLPASDTVDMTAASVESGEPVPSCAPGQSSGTVWYAFTPAVSASYTASTSTGPFFAAQMAAYVGSGLGGLTEVGCFGGNAYYQLMTFHATAGTTYYIQVAPRAFGATGTTGFTFGVAPDPVASFWYYPGDPSSFDTVQFVDFSSDPAQAGIQTRTWTFGDGTSISNPSSNPTHRYSVDGSYTVKLVVTTIDGRSATTSQVVNVATHDVAITKLTVPTAASSGQTRSITVGIGNRRYPETVLVTLYRATPYGSVVVGMLTQSVPVRSANRTTDFTFSYTFTADDAAIGKVSFQATATIQGSRDALPGDNQAQSLPTKVGK